MSRQQKAGRPHLVAATCAPCRPADKTSCPDPDILAKLPSPSLDSAASSVKQTRTRGLPPPGALARASSAEITRDGCRGGPRLAREGQSTQPCKRTWRPGPLGAEAPQLGAHPEPRLLAGFALSLTSHTHRRPGLAMPEALRQVVPGEVGVGTGSGGCGGRRVSRGDSAPPLVATPTPSRAFSSESLQN